MSAQGTITPFGQIKGTAGSYLLATFELGDGRMTGIDFSIPTFSVKRYWHERYHTDAGNRWLRASCAKRFRRRALSNAHSAESST
jgi:hypothetical protein